MFRVKIALAISAIASTSALGLPAQAQTVSSKPIGFVVPEWKSNNGQIIVRGRGRAVHDFYDVSRDFDAGSVTGNTQNNDLRALRLGVDGQFSANIKFRADANLTASQFNWADLYIGYSDAKYEVFVGQNYMAAPLEYVAPDINFPLPESSLVNLAFGQGQRNFGAIARVKSARWQVIGGIYQGNINAGDVFGDDVLRQVQVRGTYALKNKDRDALHVGGSLRVRDAQAGALLRYATRPAGTNFGPRTLDSFAIGARDTTLAFEGLYMRGSFLVTAEHQILWSDTQAGDVQMNGTYLEACYWLTGENRRYSVASGNVGQVKPKKSLRTGGPGAIAVVARLERLDQSNARLGTRAGQVDAASIGVSWTPVEFVMLRFAASQSNYSGSVAARNGTANVVMGRAQFSF